MEDIIQEVPNVPETSFQAEKPKKKWTAKKISARVGLYLAMSVLAVVFLFPV